MSLATRCAHCETVFKVVQDQLKVSEGWVRCGRCHQVFNALESLFDLERDPPPKRRTPPTDAPGPAPVPEAPPADVPAFLLKGHASAAASWPATGAAPAPLAPPPAPGPASLPSDPVSGLNPVDTPLPAPFAATQPNTLGPVPSTHEDDALDSRWLMSPARDGRSASQRRRHEEDEDDFADARFPVDAIGASELDSGSPDEEPGANLPSAPLTSPDAAASPSSPSFVRRADARARWRSPRVRATLALVAFALSLLLGTQVAVHFRRELLASYPALQPVAENLCTQLSMGDCDLTAPLALNALSIESVVLSKVQEPSDPAHDKLYRLQVVLANSRNEPVACPALELTLSDDSGNVVVRRALLPQDFHLPQAAIAARGQTTLTAGIDGRTTPLSHYTVEAFYP